MKTFLESIKPNKPPTTVLTVAEFALMKGKVSMIELMRIMERAARPRPFYIIAHACNDYGSEAEAAAVMGANAIECDIHLPDAPGEDPDWEFCVRHPPNNFGLPIKPYLLGLLKVLQRHEHVALVYFDIKNPKVNLTRFREIVHKHLTDIVPVHVIFSHSDYDGRKMFNPIKQDTPGEGLLIDEDDYPSRVSEFFEKKGLTRFGYGNGVAVPGVPKYIPASIMRGVALKWSKGDIRWVCTYTLEEDDSMRDYIAKGVDGIMVNNNNVLALKAVFNEYAGKYRLRLAERTDDPFAPPVQPSYVLTVKTVSGDGAGTDADLTFELSGSAGTVKATIDAFPIGLFESGLTNHVTLIGTDVGTIKSLTLSHNGDGDWTVGSVIVQKRGTPGVVTFNYYIPISPDKRVTRTPA